MDTEAFLSELEANGRSKHTTQSYKDVFKRLGLFKSLDTITKPDLIRFFRDFKGTDETKRLYQARIKKFFTDSGKEDIVSWIKLIQIKESLKSEDILNTDDINKLIEATDTIYFKAWMALAFESGARFNEIKRLQYKDLKETSNGLIVSIPTSKNDAIRPPILLSASANYLRNLKAHAMMKETDIVFKLSRQGLAKHLEEIQKKAEITKPVTPHRFRHAQATDMVKRNYTDAIIKAKLGWKKNSNMASRYTHLDNQSVIDATLANGGKMAESKPMTEIKEGAKVTLVEASMQFSKLSDENKELNAKMESQEKDMAELKKIMADFVKGVKLHNISDSVDKSPVLKFGPVERARKRAEELGVKT